VKFAVLGAGAIGAYVGAALARGNNDVTLIARGPHLEAMRTKGVQVLSPRGDFHVHPHATDDLEAASDADVVFVSLKAHSLPELAPRLSRALKPGSGVVWAQNGLPWWYFQSHGGPLDGLVLDSVDPGGIIARSFPPESVIGCVVYCSTEIVAPGLIRHLEGTRFTIGEPGGTRSERCRLISKAFAQGGLKGPVDERIREQIWLKLIGNAAFNPITALTGATLAQLGELPEMMTLLRELFDETAAVAHAIGIDIPLSLERRLQAGIEVGDHKTSMLQDLEAGKPLELDCMTGVVSELAERVDVDVPRTRAIHACAKLLDRMCQGGEARAGM
jgi:2-dehydropantoate 2-reductase